MDDWWVRRCRRFVPARVAAARLFLQHFTDTSRLVERPDGGLVAPLVGFLSASQPGTAYVHFVGVDPSVRRVGLGAGRYARFFQQALERGASAVTCVTSPGNTRSVACHPGLGFQIAPSPNLHDGVPVQLHRGGPGAAAPGRARQHRVTFTRALPAPTWQAAS
jgi:GNAT superfamily N-acetyltransferase